jgi:hypothetical protein
VIVVEMVSPAIAPCSEFQLINWQLRIVRFPSRLALL